MMSYVFVVFLIAAATTGPVRASAAVVKEDDLNALDYGFLVDIGVINGDASTIPEQDISVPTNEKVCTLRRIVAIRSDMSNAQ